MRHAADVQATIDAPFRCRRCDAAGTAKVTGHGIGASVSLLNGAAGDRDAAEEAMADAIHDAKRTVALARCPSCGHRSHLAIALVVVPVIGGSVVMGAFALMMFCFNSGLLSIGLGLFALFLSGVILATGYHRFRSIPTIQLTPRARLLKG